MNSLRTYNVIWAESFGPDGPEGRCRDLGEGTAGELPGLVRDGIRDAARHGWGVGDVYVTDGMGRRVYLPAEYAMN